MSVKTPQNLRPCQAETAKTLAMAEPLRPWVRPGGRAVLEGLKSRRASAWLRDIGIYVLGINGDMMGISW